MKGVILCGWLLLLILSDTLGQPINLIPYRAEDGLPTNTVNCIQEDANGLLWLGLQSGVSKWDGYTFKTFENDPKDSTTFKNGYTNGMYKSSNGALWMARRGGLSLLDQQGKFTHFEDSTDRWYYQVMELNDGQLLVASDQLVWLSSKDQPLDPIKTFPLEIESEYHFTVWNDSIFAARNYRIQHLPVNGKPASANMEIPYARFVPTLPKEFQTKLSALMEGLQIAYVYQDEAGNYWVYGRLGAVLINEAKNQLKVLTSTYIISLYEDSTGNIWLGTANEGMYRYDTFFHQFQVIPSETNEMLSSKYQLNGFFSNHIHTINNREMLVATSDGFNYFQFSGPGFKQEEIVAFESFRREDIDADFRFIFSIAHTPDYWLLSTNNGLQIWDRKTHKLLKFISEKDGERIYSNRKVLEQNGQVFFTSRRDIYQLNSDLTIDLIARTPKETTIIYDFVLEENTFWIGTKTGLFKWQRKADHQITNQHKVDGLSVDVIGGLNASDQSIFIGTVGGGLNILDKATGQIEIFTTKDGLSNNNVWGVLPDGKGGVWCSTDKGLFYTSVDRTIQTFQKEDGLPLGEFGQHGFHRSDDGHLFFGALGGIIWLDSPSFQFLSHKPKVGFSEIKINYEQISQEFSGLEGPLMTPKGITLKPEHKVLTFDLMGIDYRYADRLEYSFQLEGFNESFHTISDNNRQVTYTSLPFGDYVFKVRAAPNKGAAPAELEIPVKVLPPIHQTWWFRSLILLCGVGLVTAVVYAYNRQRYLKRIRVLQTRQKLHEERQRISRDLHDNVGAQLTNVLYSLNMVEYKVERNQANNLPEDLNKLEGKIQDTTQLLRDTIWAIHKDQLTIEDFKRKVISYLAAYLENSPSIQHKFHLIGEENKVLTSSQALQLFRIIQEAVQNTVKYADASIIDIELNAQQGLALRIKDNGKGFDMKTVDQEDHYGLDNMRERAKEIGASFSMNTAPGNGVEIEVIYPD